MQTRDGIPVGTGRCEGCRRADPYITGNEGPILRGYRGPYFCHLLEGFIEDGVKLCGFGEYIVLVVDNDVN